jgi:hypothetical protein
VRLAGLRVDFGVFPVAGLAGNPYARRMVAELLDGQLGRGQVMVEGRLDVSAEELVAQA